MWQWFVEIESRAGVHPAGAGKGEPTSMVWVGTVPHGKIVERKTCW